MFKVTTTHVDGTHHIGTFQTYEQAKTAADEWLGTPCTWQNRFRAIDMYGGVLIIYKKGE